MSAFVFHADKDGHVCGGYADTHSRSSETWRLTGFPVESPEVHGFTIAWPDGERWDHQHQTGELPPPTPEVAP